MGETKTECKEAAHNSQHVVFGAGADFTDTKPCRGWLLLYAGAASVWLWWCAAC